MKIIAKLIIFIILSPMWIVWGILDIKNYGGNYKEWELYDYFIN